MAPVFCVVCDIVEDVRTVFEELQDETTYIPNFLFQEQTAV